MSKRAAYFTLLGLVYDTLPADAVTQTLTKFKNLGVKPARVQSVRRGGTADLQLLKKIIQACLPDFVIPAEILSAK